MGRIFLVLALMCWICGVLFSLRTKPIRNQSYIISASNRLVNRILDDISRHQRKDDELGSSKSRQLPVSKDHAPVVALVTGPEVMTSSTRQNILVISPVHWLNDWVGKSRWESPEVFKNCPVSNCYLSRNSSFINKADAVLFRASALSVCRAKSKRGQIWVIFEHEAPISFKNKNLSNKCHKNVFNWTMTYRRDSDLQLVHSQFSKSKGYDENALDALIKSKTKSTVGFISHCNAQSRRDAYIRELRSYGVNIDIYGSCGNLKCNGGDRWKAVWNTSSTVKNNCFNVLDSQYKFYLSFENSLCVDYVTEKSLHLVLRHNIVPIIRDASNRTLYHPPKSYLDTKDFKDAASLAARIQQLESNLTEYKEYLTWRKHYTAETVGGVLQTGFCNMCQRLHNPEKYQRVYGDIGQFLMARGDNSPSCQNANDINDRTVSLKTVHKI